MTDGDKLLRAVCESPADDAPRLVYADWLDEHGQAERAEFIRVQCDLTQKDGGERCWVCGWPYFMGEGCEPGNCAFRPEQDSDEYRRWKPRQTEYHALRRRERELYATSAEWLLPSLPGAVDGVVYAPHEWEVVCRDTLTYGFVGLLTRGFVSALTCTAADWLAHADALAWPPESVACRACSSEGCAQHGHGDQSKMCDGSGRLALPRPTDPCPECRGHGRHADHSEAECTNCGGKTGTGKCGTGRVPRPFPPTAQPITAVRLTTLPRWIIRADYAELYTDRENVAYRCQCKPSPGALVMPDRDYLAALLAAEWPWIAFELPAADVSREEFDRITGGILERFAAASEAARQFGEAA